jgi:hypothetical protein
MKALRGPIAYGIALKAGRHSPARYICNTGVDGPYSVGIGTLVFMIGVITPFT